MNRLMLVVVALFAASCGSRLPALNDQHVRDRLIDSTAVILMDHDGVLRTGCAGFFINDRDLVTAGHCVDTTELVVIEIFGMILEMEIPSERSPLGTVYEVATHQQSLQSTPPHQPFTVVGFDRARDLALLRYVDGQDDNLPFYHSVVWLYSGPQPTVGDETVAIGHPLGLIYNVTTGIISRPMSTVEGVLHIHSAAQIFYGNSGGPLFNADGEVIGVCSWMMGEQAHLGGWVSYVELAAFLEGV